MTGCVIQPEITIGASAFTEIRAALKTTNIRLANLAMRAAALLPIQLTLCFRALELCRLTSLRKLYQDYGLSLRRTVLGRNDLTSTSPAKIEAQLAIARDLLDEATSLGTDVSNFKKRLSNLEKMTRENLAVSVAPLMRDLSEAIEEFQRAEKTEVASTVAKMESQLTEIRSLLEEARSLGVDVSRFETGLSEVEKLLGESRSKTAEVKGLRDSVDALKAELSEAVESSKRELEKKPTELEAEVYEYLMKHGGMSVSVYSKERGLTEEETKKAVDRLVELDMIDVRKA